VGWFTQPAASPPPAQPKYSLEKVEDLLTRFGPLRLQVASPQVKVLISQITWETLPYLKGSGDSPPNSAEIADIMSSLDMLIQTVEGYIHIQNNPQTYAASGNPAELLSNGRQALEAYRQKLSASAKSQTGSLSAYRALTDYLTSNSQTTT
jgi:hypothetical protein